jgi:hypothetical protein
LSDFEGMVWYTHKLSKHFKIQFPLAKGWTAFVPKWKVLMLILVFV